jgi:hypothetical protein
MVRVWVFTREIIISLTCVGSKTSCLNELPSAVRNTLESISKSPVPVARTVSSPLYEQENPRPPRPRFPFSYLVQRKTRRQLQTLYKGGWG